MIGQAAGKTRWPLRVQTGGKALKQALPRPFCTTMRRRTCAGLSIRTSLERTAPESLTPALYSFVHGDIWQGSTALPQDGVGAVRFIGDFVASNVNTRVDSHPAKESSAMSLHLGAAGRRPGRGRHRDEFIGLEHRLADRRWSLGAEGHEHPRSGNRGEPHFHVTLLGEVLDRRA